MQIQPHVDYYDRQTFACICQQLTYFYTHPTLVWAAGAGRKTEIVWSSAIIVFSRRIIIE